MSNVPTFALDEVGVAPGEAGEYVRGTFGCTCAKSTITRWKMRDGDDGRENGVESWEIRASRVRIERDHDPGAN